MKTLIFALCSVLATGSAFAEIYRCKDASGRTLTSDRPIPECANLSTQVLGKDGSVRREIAAPLTPEQRAAKKAEEEKRKADAIAAEEQKKKDQLLLAAYSNEKAIQAARERSVTQLRAEIIEANNAANSAERKRRLLQAEADKLKEKNGRVPADMQRKIAEADQSAQAERKRAEKLEVDLLSQKDKYDAIQARFKELSAANK